MSKRAPKVGRKRVPAPTSPINFRMPSALRTRLGRYASARHLSEAEALRAALSERLDEVESAAELADAERWQHQQAYATWDRHRRGLGRTVPDEQIDRIFEDALPQRLESPPREA